MKAKHFCQFAQLRKFAILPIALLAGCATSPHTVAVDVKTVDKPVSVGCAIAWPARPVPHVANVQPTGNELVDLVLIWRATEAELEERIAYEHKLEAAAQACVRGSP